MSVTEKRQKSEGRGVQSIELGGKLLIALSQESEPMMLKDVAQVAGFAPAQAHAYLVSFRKFGLVQQDPVSGRYSLGRFALDLGMTAMRTTDPMQLASDAAAALSESTALNVAVVVWGSFGPTVVEVRESGRQLNMNTRPGTVYSMSGTASGQVFSAFLPKKLVKDATNMEKRETPGSGRVGTARFLSRAELDHIRDVGFATADTPPVPGISAYAAPVFDHTGQMVLALTIIGQDDYLEPRAQSEFVPELLATCRDLSRSLGYRHAA